MNYEGQTNLPGVCLKSVGGERGARIADALKSYIKFLLLLQFALWRNVLLVDYG